MLHQAADHLEGGGVAEAVADALVGDHLEIHHAALLGGAVPLELVDGALDAVGDEHGEVTEVVDVVVDGTDAQGAHGGDDHTAVEGGEIRQGLGDPAVVVQPEQHTDGKAENGTREGGQRAGGLVEAGVQILLLLFLHDSGVELLVDVNDGVVGLEDHGYGGVGGVLAHVLLDDHIHFDVVAGVDALTADEAVESGLLGDGADVGRQHDVQEAEALVALGDHLLAEGVGFGDVQLVGKVVHGVGAVLHDEGHHLGHGLGGADAAAVLAIPPSLLAGSGTGQAGLGGGGGCFGIGHRGLQGESLLAHGGLLPICIFGHVWSVSFKFALYYTASFQKNQVPARHPTK